MTQDAARSVYEIRTAVPADAPAIREMARALFSESTRSFMPLDESAIDRQLFASLSEPFGRIGFRDRLPVAFACFGFESAEFDRRVRLKSRYLYVKPECRGSPLAHMFLRDAERFAAESGCFEVQVGLSAGINTQRVNRWFRRIGYADLGGILVVRLRHGH